MQRLSFTMLIDSHAHLDDPRFDGERGDVIERARQAGVTAIINAGADMASSRSSVALAREYEGYIFATVGIHPHSAKEATAQSYAELELLLTEPGVVAVGEIGLDYHYDLSPRPVQREVFARQLELALSHDAPVVIHMREATRDTLDILKPYAGRLRGVMHCFSGSWETAAEVLGMGLHLGFDGPITFTNAAKLCEVAAQVPLDRVLIETDCPYLAPVPHRGSRNEPAFVARVAEKLAAIKGLSRQEIAVQTANNALSLFSLR